MTHPLIDAGIELDCALRELASNTGSRRIAQRVHDAAQAVRQQILALVGDGTPAEAPVTIEKVTATLEAARRNNVPWLAIADAVRQLQGDDGR